MRSAWPSSMLCSALQGMSLNSTQSSFRCGSRLQQQARPRPALLAPGPLHIEAAHKKGGGSTKNGRDSKAKRRGVKVYGGQPVKAGGIIVRQVGATVSFLAPLFAPGAGDRLTSASMQSFSHSPGWSCLLAVPRRSGHCPGQGLHPVRPVRGDCGVQEEQV